MWRQGPVSDDSDGDERREALCFRTLTCRFCNEFLNESLLCHFFSFKACFPSCLLHRLTLCSLSCNPALDHDGDDDSLHSLTRQLTLTDAAWRLRRADRDRTCQRESPELTQRDVCESRRFCGRKADTIRIRQIYSHALPTHVLPARPSTSSCLSACLICSLLHGQSTNCQSGRGRRGYCCAV